LGAGELQMIADGPQERHLWIDVQLAGVTVHGQFDGNVNDLLVRGREGKTAIFCARAHTAPSLVRESSACAPAGTPCSDGAPRDEIRPASVRLAGLFNVSLRLEFLQH